MNGLKTFIFAIVFWMLTYLIIGLFVSFVANCDYREVLQHPGMVMSSVVVLTSATIALSVEFNEYLESKSK